jgi:hypothetical protein
MKKEILINAPAPDMDGNNAIMLAFANGNVEMAKLLLENGGEPSTVNEDGDNCFTIACEEGHVALIELLLEKGLVKLFGPIDDEGNGALHLAARGHVDTLKLLLEKGAFVNVPAGESKATALHMAVMSGKIENVKLLLSKGADVTKMSATGLTPLMCCVDDDVSNEEAIEMATLLLAAKADINKANPGGATAYDLAESNLKYPFARFLLDKGAVPKGLSANTIGVDTFNVTQYYQTGQVPGARTRAASVVLGNTLFVGGGIRCRTAEDLEQELAGRTEEEYDEISLMPFAPMSDIYSTDLTKISVQPLIKDLNKLKSTVASSVTVSHQLKGPHIEVEAGNKIHTVFEEDDCCAIDEEGKKRCETEGCEKDAEKKEGHEHDDIVFTSSVLATENYTAEHGPIAYYEMTVLSAPSDAIIASIGFTSEPNEWEFERHPGWTTTSVGFHSDDGKARVLEEEEAEEMPWIGHPWTVGDVVGAGYIFETKETFFTLNGKFLGVTISDEDFQGEAIRPVIGVGSNDMRINVNFGAEPFHFNFHVPTVEWTKLNDLPGNYLALLPLPGSTDEILVIPDSVKTIYHYHPATQQIKVKVTTAPKIQGIPLHAEHSIHLLNNKVILFSRLEALLEPGKRKTPVFMVLDLNTLVWTDILAPINMAQKKLAKALSDTQAQLSGTVINGQYYIFSPDKAYQLNLANLTLTATKLNGLLPIEDMGFYSLAQPGQENRQLTFTIGPNMTTYRWSLIDMATKQWYTPRLSGTSIEPIVGKAISAHNGKLYSYGGFSSGATIAKNFFFSMTQGTPVSGVGSTFDDESKQFFSDFTVQVGSADAQKTLNLHKVILAARSTVLAAAIEKGDASAAFPALHANSAIAVLKYLYTDSIDISLVSAKDFKTVIEAIQAIAPNQEDRIVQELLFSRTIARPDLNAELHHIGDRYADLTIEANGGSVKAHRVILASRIPALKALIGTSSSIKVDKSAAAVQQVVDAISLLSGYSLAKAPRASWDDMAALAAEWKVCCLENMIKVAKITHVDVDEVPAAVPQ